jgi:hypothetical protein
MPRHTSRARPSRSRRVRRSPGERSQPPERNAAHCPGRPLQHLGVPLSAGASADPARLTARARPEARPDRRTANLHRLLTAGSGSSRCGTSDSQVPGGRREVHRRCRQEHHRPPDSHRGEGTPHERNGAKTGQNDTSGNAHASEPTEVAVHEWPDYALQARSRGRCPPPAQASRSGVVIGCVHRDTSRQLWCRLSDHL